MRPLPTRILYASLLALVLSLAASFALAHLHPFGDADLFAAPRSQPPQLPASIPPEVRALLAAHCADCHSSTARAPFYGHFAPVSWLLEHDIVEARDHLDLSDWDQYSPDQQQVLLAEIAQQARGGHMPPPQYLLIHRNARLTATDVAALTAWTHSASLAIDSPDSVSAPPMPASPQNAVILSEERIAPSRRTPMALNRPQGHEPFQPLQPRVPHPSSAWVRMTRNSFHPIPAPEAPHIPQGLRLRRRPLQPPLHRLPHPH